MRYERRGGRRERKKVGGEGISRRIESVRGIMEEKGKRRVRRKEGRKKDGDRRKHEVRKTGELFREGRYMRKEDGRMEE